jgi:Recombination endonuclease VII
MGAKRKILATPQALAGRAARERESSEERDLRLLKMRVKNYPGLTVYSLRMMWAQQHGLCKICPTPISLQGHGSHIDHDHDTGKIRGILCARCNQGIAYFAHLKKYITQVEWYLGIGEGI